MKHFTLHVRAAALAVLLVCSMLPAVALAAAPPLQFRIDEGRNINSFMREGAVAAHLVLRSGRDPRILVAFPAGNSGVGAWFEETPNPVRWELITPPRAVTGADKKGRPLRGIEAVAQVDTGYLRVRQTVLSSVRVLRDFQSVGTVPAEVITAPVVTGNKLSWARDRLDGAPGYQLSLEVLDGGQVSASGITAADPARLRLKITALSGETPLVPLGGESLVSLLPAPDTRAQHALTFLSYEQKFLAGSWRFNTYFGRDTLISLALLGPVLQPQAMQSGIAAVLARLAPNGEVAHEEDIGEFAVLRNMKEGRGKSDAPIYDYRMVDDDLMLPPVAAEWLLGKATRVQASGFLRSRHAGGRTNGDSLVSNLQRVVERTAAFAADPRVQNLVGLHEGRMTGQWRDSLEGLARGRYAYDVNAVFVPASLAAIDRLVKSGLLDPYTSADQRRVLQQAAAQQRVWTDKAPPLFVVAIPADQARKQVAAYARSIGVEAAAPLAKLGDETLQFNALSLDAAGRPIPVMHSDDGFALLFGMPSPSELERSIRAIMRPFPAGLLTPVGMLVANPVFTGPEVQARFSNSAYHGTVVWSWQQAVLAAGLNRQLARTDLPASLLKQLSTARAEIWDVIVASNAVRTSELWSWSFTNGRYQIEPFGQRGTDEDESNAAQLWSTVFLALPRPRAD
jgi:hypothetical protein